jgi:hypothetical protein
VISAGDKILFSITDTIRSKKEANKEDTIESMFILASFISESKNKIQSKISNKYNPIKQPTNNVS